MTWPTALDAYGFFHNLGPVECVLWAFGCMTTAVGFPGELAPVPVKALHAAILTTGIFQITYLLACFSIMASAEGERVVRRAVELAGELATGLSQTEALEADVRNAIETRAVHHTGGREISDSGDA